MSWGKLFLKNCPSLIIPIIIVVKIDQLQHFFFLSSPTSSDSLCIAVAFGYIWRGVDYLLGLTSYLNYEEPWKALNIVDAAFWNSSSTFSSFLDEVSIKKAPPISFMNWKASSGSTSWSKSHLAPIKNTNAYLLPFSWKSVSHCERWEKELLLLTEYTMNTAAAPL